MTKFETNLKMYVKVCEILDIIAHGISFNNNNNSHTHTYIYVSFLLNIHLQQQV